MTEEVKKTRKKKSNPKDRGETYRESQKKRLERLKSEGYVILNSMVKKEVKDYIAKFQKDHGLGSAGDAIEMIVEKLKSDTV